MPEYLSPGVYVEEVDTGNKPIEGVATSTVGFLGVAERGTRTPMLVTSFTEYARNFGRYNKPSVLAYAVEGFFQNGGKRCFIARVASKTAIAASKVTGSNTARVLRLIRGPTANPSAKKTESSLPRSAIRPSSWKCRTSSTRRCSVRGWRQAAS